MNKPKLIYYNDARHYSFYRYDPPMSLHQLRQPIDELLGTGVDTLSYGLASGQTFFHDTKVGIPWGDVGGDHNHGVMWWRASENAREAIAMGHDVLRVVVDRAHEKGMQVLCSMRMNDPSIESNMYMMSRLKRECPEVMIGQTASNHKYAATCEDYAREDVRVTRLSLIEEVMRYGADGIEMDPYVGVFFHPSKARQNTPILTEFVVEVRKLLDRIGGERGTKLCVALRVYPNEEQNLAIGMDVRKWIQDGLVDLVVPNPPGILWSPETDIRWLLDITADASTWVYVPMGRDPYDDRNQSLTIETRRAVATNIHAIGADGVYLSDLPWPHDNNVYQTLRELGDPEIYSRKSKQYVVPVRGADTAEFVPSRSLPVELSEGVRTSVSFLVSDRLREAEADEEIDRVELSLRVVQYCPKDELTFAFNGTRITPERSSHYYGGLVPYGVARSGLPQRIDTHYWFCFDLPSTLVLEGVNELDVSLEKLYKPLTATRVLQSVELSIGYKEPFTTVGGQL